jgi:hypothetical protein
MTALSLIGKKYNRLTVISGSHTLKNRKHWVCECECGNKKIVSGNNLKSGQVKSCGCLRNENLKLKLLKHGMSESQVYNIYCKMLSRCNNLKDKAYPSYGGRGIKVCERWLNFENFYLDMGERPAPEYSIDRIDNNKGYSPDNCRYATPTQQARNTRRNRIINIDGVKKPLCEWLEIMGLSLSAFQKRLIRGWDENKAITTKIMYIRNPNAKTI